MKCFMLYVIFAAQILLAHGNRINCHQCRWSNSAVRSADSGSIAVVLNTNCNGDLTSAATAIAEASVSGDIDAVSIQVAVGLSNPDPQSALLQLYTSTLSYASVADQGIATGYALASIATQINSVISTNIDLQQIFWTSINNLALSPTPPSCSFFKDTIGAFTTAVKKNGNVGPTNAPNLTMLCPHVTNNLSEPNRLKYNNWAGSNKHISDCGKQKIAAAAVAVSMTVVSDPSCSVGQLPPQTAAVAVATASVYSACNFATALALTCSADLSSSKKATSVLLTSGSQNIGSVLAVAATSRTCDASSFVSMVLQQITNSIPAISCATAKSIASDFCSQIQTGAQQQGDAQLSQVVTTCNNFSCN